MPQAYKIPLGTTEQLLKTLKDHPVSACIDVLLETGLTDAWDTFFPLGMSEKYLGTFPKELDDVKASDLRGQFHGGPPGRESWHDSNFLEFTLDRFLYTITSVGFADFRGMVKDTATKGEPADAT